MNGLIEIVMPVTSKLEGHISSGSIVRPYACSPRFLMHSLNVHATVLKFHI